MPWYSFFAKIGTFLKRALTFVETYVTDEHIDQALQFARVAAQRFPTNPERREWVVSLLVARGMPENIARLAVEIAVGLLKREKAEGV